ncbi:cytochrome b [Sulfuricystis multivorans]|uniref:cytochrome b n=1 Tax=Sulfuricystis multivorans TaxID=2211108 RepID=UPI000F83D901|nr:cytochrome b N-terminal domain-containing protein [Sulfuricystis multivorans]
MAGANVEKYKSDGTTTGNLLEWLDARFPLMSLWNDHLAKYYAPKNFNFWYFFGSLALLVLVLQILTGVFLVMHYKPDASLNASGVPVAFASVEYIMRDVPWGWLIRYMHSTGASAFFIVVYLHMFRGMLYGSYRTPRELVWIVGVVIFLVLMATAFMGYLLPWGQMSYWGAQVILNLFTAIPLIGPDLGVWIRGDYVVGDATLNRLFSLHYLLPVLILPALVAVHLIALHEVGSNNPDGIEIKKKKDETGKPLDGIPFHPYYTVKDIVGVVAFLMVFSVVVFFMPEGGGYFLEANNFFPADPLVTPPHIAPVWYFGPFYSILRANTVNFFWVDAKLWGVIFMGLGVLIFAFLPWLDRSPVKSIRYRGPLYKGALTIFVISFVILGYLGMLAPTPGRTLVAQICTILYFAFFLLMPIYTSLDKCKPEPERVTK